MTFFRHPIFWTLLLIGIVTGMVALSQNTQVLNLSFWGSPAGKTLSEVVRNLGLLALAIVALPFAVWRAWVSHREAETRQQLAKIAQQQTAQAEQGQITDRFAKSVELLGSNNPTVRTGAIFALGRIAQDSVERDHIPVMQILSNFVRYPPYSDRQELAASDYEERLAHYLESDKTTPPPETNVIECPDVLAAMEVIGERNGQQRAWEEENEYQITFRSAQLKFMNLTGANLKNVTINAADMRGSRLSLAMGAGANFTGVNLQKAELRGTNLSGAVLSGAKLNHSLLSHVRLQNANLDNADLSNAFMFNVRFDNAIFRHANIVDAHLRGSTLRDAQFEITDITGSDLGLVHGLTANQLKNCLSDRGRQPRLPEKLKHIVLTATPFGD